MYNIVISMAIYAQVQKIKKLYTNDNKDIVRDYFYILTI